MRPYSIDRQDYGLRLGVRLCSGAPLFLLYKFILFTYNQYFHILLKMFQNISSTQIKEHKKIKNNFLNADFKKLNFSCNIYSGNFYLDTFNYFLINEDFITFNELFTRDVSLNIDHFFTDKFFNNFNKNINNFKEFKKLFVLGSYNANNFYSNIIQFLPRIFFIKKILSK